MNALSRSVCTIGAACALAVGLNTAHAQKPSADYYPLKVGNTWTYSGKFGDKTITEIATVKNVSATGATVEWTANGRVVQTEVYAVSPQGLSRVEAGLGGKISPPIPFIKYPLKAGKKWTWKGTISAQGQTIPGDSVVSVIGTEVTKTPAGTFKAIHIHSALTLNMKGSKLVIPNDIWLAPGVGPVQQTAQAGTLTITVKLTSDKLK